jgi:hypothetical protein
MSAAQLDEAFYHISPCLHESCFSWEEMSCTAYGHAKGWWVSGVILLFHFPILGDSDTLPDHNVFLLSSFHFSPLV